MTVAVGAMSTGSTDVDSAEEVGSVSRSAEIVHPVARYGRVFRISEAPTRDQVRLISSQLQERSGQLLDQLRSFLRDAVAKQFALSAPPEAVPKEGEKAALVRLWRDEAPMVQYQGTFVESDDLRFVHRVVISVCTPKELGGNRPVNHSKCWSRIVLDKMHKQVLLTARDWKTFRLAAKQLNVSVIERVLYPFYWHVIHDTVPTAQFSNEAPDAREPSPTPPNDYEVCIDATNSLHEHVCSLLRQINVSPLGMAAEEPFAKVGEELCRMGCSLVRSTSPESSREGSEVHRSGWISVPGRETDGAYYEVISSTAMQYVGLEYLSPAELQQEDPLADGNPAHTSSRSIEARVGDRI